MRIIILGGDGYLGWPTAMHFAAKGHEVAVADNFAKRRWEAELGIQPLIPIPPLLERIRLFKEKSGHEVRPFIGDIEDYEFVSRIFGEIQPEAIIHFGEQPSAPYSMVDIQHAAYTQRNNVVGTLNVLFAMRKHTPDAHLVKLGTMGEYGTPNIDIEEGYIEIEHKGRKDILPFPKQAGSFYHLSKVHDSHNILFATKIWDLRATDLNQGVVYGIETDQTKLDDGLITSFHYDGVFGTALNRFCVQAIVGVPLTLYGKGGQRRGFLNIVDTMQCVELAVLNPADQGEFRVFNQFTEVFSVTELAELVCEVGSKMGYNADIDHIDNPRVEKEDHYYNPTHTKLLDLGLSPHNLSDVMVDSMLHIIDRYKDRVDRETIMPKITWR